MFSINTEGKLNVETHCHTVEEGLVREIESKQTVAKSMQNQCHTTHCSFTYVNLSNVDLYCFMQTYKLSL